MSDDTTEPTQQSNEAENAPPSTPKKPVRWFRRLGCLLAFVIWLVVMLVPCFFITLAFQQQIVITQGSAPNQVLRVWLINEADHRGLGLSTASTHPDGTDAGLCVQTDVSFLLWVGQANPVTYCECYLRSGDDFEFTGATDGSCSP